MLVEDLKWGTIDNGKRGHHKRSERRKEKIDEILELMKKRQQIIPKNDSELC